MHLESVTIKVHHFKLHSLLKYMEHLKEHFEFVWKMRGKNSTQSSSWQCQKPLHTNKTVTQRTQGRHLRQAEVPSD
jgi:hypothetical protein